jgi:hypothetical protein
VVPRASSKVFKFQAPGLISSGTESVRFNFQILSAWTHFRRYKGRRVQFPSFVLPDSFLVIPRMLGPVFKFHAPELIFGGIESVKSSFQVRAPKLIFGSTEGVGSSFQVSHSRTYFKFTLQESLSAIQKASGPVFKFGIVELIFGGINGAKSNFQFSCSKTHFWQYRGTKLGF